MRKSLAVGDDVVFLYCQFVERGKVLKINKKTIKVHCPNPGPWCKPFDKNVLPDRVAYIDDVLAVVWDSTRGVEGSYRFDYVKYPQYAKRAGDWGQPFTYVKE